MSIPVTTSTGFHWPSKDRETKLMIRLCDSHASDGSVNSNPNTGSTTGSATERSSWNWSGEFSIDSLGEETLKIRSASNRTDVVLVRVSVRLVESTIIVNFEPSEIKVVPYRINNNTSHKIRFRQNTGNEDDRFDEMGPRESLPYSWDEPTKQRILQIEFQQGSKWVSKNYKLDVLALHHRVQLTRTLPDLSNPEFQGYLYRSHGNLLESKWVRSYCVLRKATLYIFRANQKAVKGNDGESNNTPEVRKMDLQGIIHLGPGKQFNLSSLASMDDLCSKVTVKQSKEREVGWSKKIGLALQDMAEAAIMGGGGLQDDVRQRRNSNEPAFVEKREKKRLKLIATLLERMVFSEVESRPPRASTFSAKKKTKRATRSRKSAFKRVSVVQFQPQPPATPTLVHSPSR